MEFPFEFPVRFSGQAGPQICRQVQGSETRLLGLGPEGAAAAPRLTGLAAGDGGRPLVVKPRADINWGTEFFLGQKMFKFGGLILMKPRKNPDELVCDRFVP